MTRPPISADRRALIAKVHVAKKALGLDDETYRAILSRVSGQESCANCREPQLAAVLAEFRRLGWEEPPERAGWRPASGKSHVRLVWAIWGELQPLLDNADADTLRGFVRRQTKTRKNPAGISDPEWLDPAEAKKVIHGLRGWLDRTRLKGGSDVAA
jgi:hypothetical protein